MNPHEDIAARLDAALILFYNPIFGQTSPYGARVSRSRLRCRDSERLGLFRGRQAGVFSSSIEEYDKNIRRNETRKRIAGIVVV